MVGTCFPYIFVYTVYLHLSSEQSSNNHAYISTLPIRAEACYEGNDHQSRIQKAGFTFCYLKCLC